MQETCQVQCSVVQCITAQCRIPPLTPLTPFLLPSLPLSPPLRSPPLPSPPVLPSPLKGYTILTGLRQGGASRQRPGQEQVAGQERAQGRCQHQVSAQAFASPDASVAWSFVTVQDMATQASRKSKKSSVGRVSRFLIQCSERDREVCQEYATSLETPSHQCIHGWYSTVASLWC